MKRLLWLALGLAALPAQAQQRPEDPVAFKCYMCTEGERIELALSKGVGEQYVFGGGISASSLYGYRVTSHAGQLVSEPFRPAGWMASQYETLMYGYKADRGANVVAFGTVALHAPGSPHVRSDNRLWGHHVSALNPVHEQAREIARRSVESRMQAFVNADAAHGRILRLESEFGERLPLIVRLNIIFDDLGYIEYLFDHASRSWNYLWAGDFYHRIQETPEDFLSADGSPRTFRYPALDGGEPYLVKRAHMAGIEVLGELSGNGTPSIYCSRVATAIQCRINNAP